MKTVKKLNFAITRSIATLITIVLFGGLVMSQAGTLSKTSMVQKDRSAIDKDLASIDQRQQRVKLLQEKCKEERTTGSTSCPCRNELMKANADLEKDKAYLKADKAELMKDRQGFINEHKDAVKADRAALKESQKNLNASLSKGNTVAVLYAQQIVNNKHDLKLHETALKQAITERNNELVATNKKIKSANAESPALLAFESSAAKTQNSLVK